MKQSSNLVVKIVCRPTYVCEILLASRMDGWMGVSVFLRAPIGIGAGSGRSGSGILASRSRRRAAEICRFVIRQAVSITYTDWGRCSPVVRPSAASFQIIVIMFQHQGGDSV